MAGSLGAPVEFGGDGGPAVAARFACDSRTAVDELGRVYIVDCGNHRVRRVDSAGIIDTIAGNGTLRDPGNGVAATSADLEWPTALSLDAAGNLYIVDTDGSRVLRVATDGTVSRVAGIGNLGYSGDGGPATLAAINTPYGVAIDPAGNLYIADTLNDVIRRVDTSGTITTFAGTGAAGFSGDGGPAIDAELAAPRAVGYDAASSRLIFVDGFNNRIRAVGATGTITTIAGGGTSTAEDIAATTAQIAYGTGLAIGNGNIYYSDSNQNVVRRIDSNGLVRTVAGNGTTGYSGNGGPATSAQLDGPNSIAVSGSNLYIAEIDNNVVRRVDANGTISLVAGDTIDGDGNDGAAASGAQLSFPEGVAARGSDIYISDSGNYRCRRIASDGKITTIAGRVDPEGTGPITRAHLADPRALLVAPNLTLIAGGESGTVQAVRGTTLEAVAGRYLHDTATGTLARFRDRTFGSVGGVAYDAATSRIFITETSANRLHVITIVDPANAHTWTITPLSLDTVLGARDGSLASARFRNPTGLYFEPATKTLYVTDTGNHAIRAIDLSAGVGSSAPVTTIAGTLATRGYFGDSGPAASALLYAPLALTRCPNGDVFIADTGNHRVRRIAAGTQTITTVVGDGVAASSGEGAPATTFPVHAPAGLACDAANNLFVTSSTAVRLLPSTNGGVDGTGPVQTIYGAAPRDEFPARVTTCLTGIAIIDATTVHATDSCTGVLVELKLTPAS